MRNAECGLQRQAVSNPHSAICTPQYSEGTLMAVIHDIIPAFELYQPASIDDAIKLLDTHGADALVLAGGLDSMDWLKDRLKRPKVGVDLGQIKELKGIKETNGGLEIRAQPALNEVGK